MTSAFGKHRRARGANEGGPRSSGDRRRLIRSRVKLSSAEDTSWKKTSVSRLDLYFNNSRARQGRETRSRNYLPIEVSAVRYIKVISRRVHKFSIQSWN